MHRERYDIAAGDGAMPIARPAPRGGRVVAVGTTSLRALESAARGRRRCRPGSGETDLFITPGYRLPRRRPPAHQFPPAEVDAADAGVAPSAASTTIRARLPPRHRAALPLLQLRRRHADRAQPHHEIRTRSPPTAPRAAARLDPAPTAPSRRRPSCRSAPTARSRRWRPTELRDIGAQIVLGNTFHLWLRPGLDVIARPRRPAPLHGLGRADPHRLRRLPGVQPRRAAQDHRGGREVPVAGQRRPPVPDAGGIDAHPARAELRHRDDLRRMHALPGRPRAEARGLDAPVAALGARAARARARRQPERAVRHRPGRHVRGPARRVAGRTDATSASTATPSAACRWASRRRTCCASSPTPRRACRRTSRAT